MRLFETLGIDVVFDVGAGSGQYASKLRASGYRGRIVSFEPMASASAAARTAAAGDPAWTVEAFGLGAEDREATLNIAGNSVSSSLLAMLPSHEETAPGSANVGVESVRIRRFDHLPNEMRSAGKHPCFKVDTQGYELAVLRGTGDQLARMELLQLELSLVPLYTDGPLYDEVMRFVDEAGFKLAGIVPGFSDHESGQMLQMDGFFIRHDRLPRR